MLRQSLCAIAFAALGFSRDPGCGGIDDPDGGPNAPCTRSSDCGGGLVCLEGVCRERDGGEPDAGSGEPEERQESGGAGDGAEPDGGSGG